MSDAFVTAIANVVSAQTDLSPAEVEELIETPPSSEMGDYAVPCFALARKWRKPPAAIAAELAAKIAPSEYLAKVENAGPYLNFFVNKRCLAEETLKRVATEGARYGTSNVGAGKTVVIDFSHPNIAKPFGIHHLRSTVIGNALRNVYRALGYHVVGINHLGDWGTQFGKLLAAWQRWGTGELTEDISVATLLQLYVRIHDEIENDPAVEEEARAWFRRLEQGDPEARRMWEVCRNVSLKEFNRVYEMLGITFESVAGESFYQDKIHDTLQRLQDKGLTTVSEGATIVDLKPWGMPPFIARRRDDASLYATRDLAAAEYRWSTYHFDKMLYVVDVAQSLHFQQLFKVLELMGYEWHARCAHVVFGRMLGLSTREGKVIFLEDVLNHSIELARKMVEEKNPDLPNKDEVAQQVGIGAVIFADLKRGRIKDYVFDWEEVLNPFGDTGPYLQYTHARFCSILRKAAQPVVMGGVDYARLSEAETVALIKAIAAFPRAVQQAARDYEPSIVSRALLDIADKANKFYEKHQVIGVEETTFHARLLLVDCTRQVLANGLRLLGIAAPEEM
ncbi:MAG: arginine--tRNA ligase [Abditibacteriales bacterium]|nr:arginine--tRNA ligase [Abditibacteriales bacterium]MDW8367547.1 arginine--tRNA ligase [Abditibacteriales bacterium]